MVNHRKAPPAPSPAASLRRSGRSAASPDLSGLEPLHRPTVANGADLLTDAEQAPASSLPATRELPQLLTVAEFGDVFGRSPRTIRSWIARGLIRRVKVGNSVFIPITEIDALLSSQD